MSPSPVRLIRIPPGSRHRVLCSHPRRVRRGRGLPGQPATTLPKASCGTAMVHWINAETQVLGGEAEALTCFGAAARSCRPASIEVTVIGVDTGTSYVFTVGSGGTPCQVVELSQDYSANFGGSTSTLSTVRAASPA